ncbi:MAG TPA: hypothetical protein VFS89_02155 [Nitrosospira sp.]|nr:hypothetical protein [Nitrosospira sp.]
MIDSNFSIGFSSNLINGLNPKWQPQAGLLNILYPAEQQAMALRPVEPIARRGNWSYPAITLHESALDLLDELIPYQVINPSSDIDAPSFGAGALLVGATGSQPSLKMLSKTIGVDLTRTDMRYALVKLERVDGADNHASAVGGILVHARPRQPDPEYGLSTGFTSASTRLRHAGRSRLQDYGDQLNKDDGNKVLDSFREFGTHYVSAVELGDTILQVFAYPPEQFAKLKLAYADGNNPLSGPGSQNFVQFTTDRATGIYGYVEQYGDVICLSNSAIFNSTLHDGHWRDALWSHKNSVFSLFNVNSRLSLVNLQQEFTEQAVVAVHLASLSVMIEQKRGLIWQRIFKGAMAQKYRTTIQPNFSIYDQRDFVRMLPQDTAGITSFIATPTVNVYKARLDLADMQLVAASEVQDFVLFTNVLSAGGNATIQVPGKKVRLFGQVLDMRVQGQPKSISLTDEAFDSLQLGCDEFLGALAIQNRSGSRYSVIVDGLRFDLDGSGSGAMPFIADDVRTVPPADAVPLLTDSLQFSMTFAEAVISDQSTHANSRLQQFVRSYLTWVTEMLPAGGSEESIALRVRAMDLANYVTNPEYGSFVPILPYGDYEQYVQSILSYLDRIQLQVAQNEQRMANRRQQELVIDVARTLNQNIIASGELISGVIEANTAQQKDLEGFYDALIVQGKAEAEQQQAKINNLNASLFQARGDVDLAVQKYKSAVQQWETMEAIKFGLEVATNLFSLGTSIAIPASSISAVKDLGLMVQRIQKTLNVLNAMSKLYTGISTGAKGLENAQRALDDLDGAQFGSPSTLSWDEMSIQFNQIMASGPDIKPEKASLQAAFATLVLRGKAVASAESSLHALRRDIYTNQKQKEINSRQAARLEALQQKLHPARVEDLDRSAIDLVALTGYLTFIQNQMLTILAKAFLMQDLALQYVNLQPATPVLAFSLLKFSAAVVQQQAATLEAKSLLAHYQASRTKPIEYVIEGVKPEELTGGNVFLSTIFLDAPAFYQYVNARIISVVAVVEGVKSTASGIYLLRLAYNGTPFHDRNLHRDPLSFRTPWRERIYSYNAHDNSPNFSDDGESWSEGVSRVTPFSTWEISLPNTSTNKDLSFARDTLTVRLSFVLEARIADPLKIMQQRAATRLLAFAPPRQLPGLLAASDVLLSTGANLPSTETLLAQMNAQGSCTNGWDVVFNMDLKGINSALLDQYETLKKDTVYKNRITVNTSEKYPGGVTVINRFTIDYGYPLLSFSINNNNSATLSMEILSGSVQRCSQVGSLPEQCDTPESISGETFSAVIQLAKVAGTVKIDNGNHNVLKVQLDMKEGAFSISNIDLSDATKVEFNKAVKEYFVSNPVIYLINQLDLTAIPTLDALKPNDFIFKPLQTPANNQMLQLFIMTGGRAVLNYSQAFLNNIPEPLPQGQSNSMMVRSELIFKEVLPQSLRNNGWSLEGVNPGNTTKAWSGKFTGASVIGTVDLSKLNHNTSTSSRYGGSMTDYTYSVPGGNDVSWSLVDTTIAVQPNGQMYYSGSRKQSLQYNQKSCTTRWPCFSNCTRCRDSSLATDVTIEVRSSLPLSVGGDGRDQTIQIKTTSQGVVVSGHLSGGGPSGSDDLAAQVNQQIQSQVPPQIVQKLSIQFEAVSVFALKNLLFPANNYITFSSCAVPGDLILLGNFHSTK